MKKKYKIGIITAVIIFNPFSLLLFFIISVSWSNAHPEIGMNEKSVSWLPKDATNISYYKTYGFRAFEFDISEDAFKKWASENWDIKEIDIPVKIERYTYMLIASPSHDTDSDPEGKKYNEYENQVYAQIKRGYYYRTPPRGNGGSSRIGYDLDKGRAYFQSSPR